MTLEVLTVTADEAIVGGLELAGLICLLVERVARYARDRLWVVRLRWGAPMVLSPGTPPLEIFLDVGMTPVQALQAFIDAFALEWGGDFDLLVLDPSPLFAGPPPSSSVNPLLFAALAVVGPPARISYLFDDPVQWDALPNTVGPISGVELLPTVLLPDAPPDDGPGALWMGLFDDLANSSFPTPASALAALTDLAQGVVRFYNGAGAPAGAAWPQDAVKLRLTTSFRATIAAPYLLEAMPLAAAARTQAQVNLERWARAVTARRVGVALGGGGALSFVGAAFIEKMSERQLPLDVVSGTSFGSIVAGYYAVRGAAGLQAVVRHWYWAQLTVAFGWLTGAPLQLWLDLDLGFAEINDLEVTFVPVAANAYTGHAWLLRVGVVGHTCAASGSLPPLSPTYDGNIRLLDGALTAGVPAAVVAMAGANLVVGANVVPYPPMMVPDPVLPAPRLWNMLRSLNPLRRMLDFSRGYQMMLRQGGHSQDTYADVVYPADTTGIDGIAFYAGQAIVDQALQSTPLKQAIDQLELRWLDLLRHAAGRIRFWYVDDAILLGGDVAAGGATTGPLDAVGFTAGGALEPDTIVYLERIAAALKALQWVYLMVRVDYPELAPVVSVLRRDTILEHFITVLGVPATRVTGEARHGPGITTARVELRVWVTAPPLPAPSVVLV